MPDFVIIGAAKSATTWLQRSLQSHPAIFMPDPELHFFSRAYDRGLAWYAAQFAAGAMRLRGEKSNSYLDTPEAAARLHRALPRAKLIAQLRNPVERAYSDYCMLYRRGEVDGRIEQHLDVSQARFRRFVEGGRYAEQLQRFLDLYPREQLFVPLYDDVQRRPELVLNQACKFLGVPALPPDALLARRVKDKTAHMVPPALRRRLRPFKPLVHPMRGTWWFEKARALVARELRYPAMTPELRTRLVDYYSAEVERLGRMLGRDLSFWLSAPSPAGSEQTILQSTPGHRSVPACAGDHGR